MSPITEELRELMRQWARLDRRMRMGDRSVEADLDRAEQALAAYLYPAAGDAGEELAGAAP